MTVARLARQEGQGLGKPGQVGRVKAGQGWSGGKGMAAARLEVKG